MKRLLLFLTAAFFAVALIRTLPVHGAGEPLTISAPVTLSGSNTISAPTFIDTTGAGAYFLDPSAATSLVVAGNVGIGTTGPGALLHLNGNNVAYRGQLTIQATDYAQITFYEGATTQTNMGAQIYWDAAANDFVLQNYNGGSAGDLLLNPSSGNVGIGVPGPQAKLDIGQGVVGGAGELRIDARLNGSGPGLKILAGTRTGGESVFEVDNNLGNRDFVILANGNVGIGTTSPSTKLQVVGTITGTTKNFEIDHPTKPGMKLIHSTLEGPEVAVFYRGEAVLTNGKAVVVLPEYFEALTRVEGRTVQLTAKNGWSPLYVDGEVVHGRFTVKADSGNPSQQFFWEVKAVRKDVPPLQVEKSVH